MNPLAKRPGILVVLGVVFGIAALLYFFSSGDPILLVDSHPGPDTLPSQLSDAEFWEMTSAFSEPNGYFRSDNFLSNEAGAQDVIPELKSRIKPGGVYIGVGPEQNFTYILALEPRMAFIVDIRRLNLIEHLMYKALFEMADDRPGFVSLLFSRARPSDLASDVTVSQMFDAFRRQPPDKQAFEQNLAGILSHLEVTRHFHLSADDEDDLRYAYHAFFQAGPDLSYSFLGTDYNGRLRNMPTYAELMAETDGKHNWSFLANEAQFQKMRSLQQLNLIVPLVGDFAGPKALRAVAQYIRAHQARLSVFYTSNVEMYLFREGTDWKDFYRNVGTMPVDASSTFIRFAVNRNTFSLNRRMARSQMWSPIREVLTAFGSGDIEEYADVIAMSK